MANKNKWNKDNLLLASSVSLPPQHTYNEPKEEILTKNKRERENKWKIETIVSHKTVSFGSSCERFLAEFFLINSLHIFPYSYSETRSLLLVTYLFT